MRIEEKGKLRILMPEEGCLLFHRESEQYFEMAYLPKNHEGEGYQDVLREHAVDYTPSIEIEKIKFQQETQNNELVQAMSETTDLYELILDINATTPTMLTRRMQSAPPASIVVAYQLLVKKGAKTIEQVPDTIKPYFET